MPSGTKASWASCCSGFKWGFLAGLQWWILFSSNTLKLLLGTGGERITSYCKITIWHSTVCTIRKRARFSIAQRSEFSLSRECLFDSRIMFEHVLCKTPVSFEISRIIIFHGPGSVA
ncbi:hypothetical protein L873DRAFT_525648 [Choiromyces venosus 120613-1]|uniref:Uncharacterized protein n=1 Tax=Choiromyces venosus 120613-1 TaxID=1336337 RepID=A0A3N4K514_9PEZI|nr:hypothetical protein L873DRAFT_525648 [Choiromyces venosus 120613-1]